MKNDYMVASEVAAVLRCSLSKAYQIMQAIHKEMKSEGLIVIHGRVPRQRLLRRVGLA